MEGQEYLWLFTKSLHNEEPKFDSCHANINQAFNNLHETGPEWQVNCGKDDFAHHFGGGDCSDELIQSEHSSTYEQYRPSSLIDNHYVNEHEPISEPSCSNAAPDIDWTNRNFNAGHNQTYQSVEMMITFRTCDSCNIAIKSLNAALNHIVSVNHMTNTNFCVVCLTNLGDKLAYEHRKEEEHVQKAKIYCLLCSVEVRDQYGMKLHQNGSKHRKTIKKFDEILKCNTKYNESLQIRAKGSPTDIIKSGCCESCPNWIMESSVQQVVAHLANENHLINSKCCIICNEKFLSASSARLHMTLDQHKKKAKLTCLVCNVKGPENNMWDHMTGAKHRQKILTLNKLLEDREVVKTDSKTLTWFPDLTNFPLELKKLILIDACRLCKVKLPVQFDVTNHYQGERHKKNVATWLINYEELKKHDAITPPPLSSTPGAMLYNLLNNFPELVSENVNSPNSKLQVAQPHNTNDTSLANSLQVSGEVPESSQKLQTAFSHQDNLQKTSTEVQGVVYCNPVQGSGSESSGGSDIDIKQSENELYKSKLEDKVLSEIKKLVNSLYYSKKVPLDKALEYLKRFNKEIKECVHKVRFAHSNTNLPEVNLNRSSTEKTCFLSSFAVNETDICIEPGQDKIESEQKSAQNNLRAPKKNDFLENGVQIFDKFDSEVEKFLLDTQNNKHFQASPNESSFENKQCFAKNETDISITQRQDKTEFGQLGSKLDSKLEYQSQSTKNKNLHILIKIHLKIL